MIKHIQKILFYLLFLSLVNCAGSGQLANSGSERTYGQNIQTINNYFLQISRNSSFLINEAHNDAKRKSYTISRPSKVGDDYSRNQIGHVTITYLAENKTTIKIENPRYPFGFPDYKKVDYQRIIFSRLEDMLKQN